MADHAVDIAKITIRLEHEKYIKELIDIPQMGEIVNEMIKESLDAYVEGDIVRLMTLVKKMMKLMCFITIFL